jgi:hypothetical protein
MNSSTLESLADPAPDAVAPASNATNGAVNSAPTPSTFGAVGTVPKYFGNR